MLFRAFYLSLRRFQILIKIVSRKKLAVAPYITKIVCLIVFHSNLLSLILNVTIECLVCM